MRYIKINFGNHRFFLGNKGKPFTIIDSYNSQQKALKHHKGSLSQRQDILFRRISHFEEKQ